MKDLSRRVRKARRKVYRQMPIATGNRIAELDHRMSYADMTATVAQGNLGVLSGGAALALWRVCHERGFRAWCYEFGFSQSLTHTVTIIEIDGGLQVHDAFFNVGYPRGFDDMLDALRLGNTVDRISEVRDRKIYIVDPNCEAKKTVCWLEAHADRELAPTDGLRRFELLWNQEAFTAIHPGSHTVSRDLAARGYANDLQFMMLHPVAVFDGERQHRDPATMPLVSGRDLRSPVAEQRLTVRDLEAERATGAERGATIARLEAELAEASSRAAQLASDSEGARRSFAAEREAWLQQKVALQARKSALEGELSETRVRLSAANDLRAQRDSQIAQLRAEIDDARQQFEAEQKTVLALEGTNHDVRMQLEQSRWREALLESEVTEAREHAIEISHCVASLLDELGQLRRDYRSLAMERRTMSRDKAWLEAEITDLKAEMNEAVGRAARLEAKIAGATGARFSRLWGRITTRCSRLLHLRRARDRPDASSSNRPSS